MELLTDAGLLGYKAVKTLMDSNIHLSQHGGTSLVDISGYRLVGRLLYLTTTRLDLTYVV